MYQGTDRDSQRKKQEDNLSPSKVVLFAPDQEQNCGTYPSEH